MNLAKKLYDLQHLDSEIQSRLDTLSEFNTLLGNNQTLLTAKNELLTIKKHLSDKEKEHRDLEWEVDDLSKKIAKINDKLYGGNVINPKELLSLKQEIEILKSKLSEKEDSLLDIMDEEEKTQTRILSDTKNIRELEEKWQKDQVVLLQKKDEVKNKLDELDKKRSVLVQDIECATLQLYEGLKTRKGQAVVKVEQGRCQGCRITLSTSAQQRARSGAVVQCGSCGMILFIG